MEVKRFRGFLSKVIAYHWRANRFQRDEDACILANVKLKGKSRLILPY